MNRTLKETLTKLTLETGGDWEALLPFALFRVQNLPYMLGLTPFEIMFGRPPPIVPSLKTDLIADLPVDALFSSLRLLQWVHKDIWKRLEGLYLTKPPPELYHFRPGDWVYGQRHHSGTLGPHWKGPYSIILVTPTALKVDGISTWVHFSHVRPADPFTDIHEVLPQWRVSKHPDNPLKLKLWKRPKEASPS